MKRLVTGVVLLACAGAALAQGSMPRDTDRNRDWTGRVPRDGVAPMLDIRLQDAGVTLPPEQKEEEAPKPPAKPEAAPAPAPAAPTASEQPAPPAPPK